MPVSGGYHCIGCVCEWRRHNGFLWGLTKTQLDSCVFLMTRVAKQKKQRIEFQIASIENTGFRPRESLSLRFPENTLETPLVTVPLRGVCQILKFIFKLPQEVSSSASKDSEFWPGLRTVCIIVDVPGVFLSSKGLSAAPVQTGGTGSFHPSLFT
jgi:hypothetical protein